MTALARSLALLLAMTGPASAHAVFGLTGFSGGLLHPLLVPTHILALVALALLIGQQGWSRSVAIVYVVAVVAGLVAIALAFVPRFAEEALLALAALTGLAVALARQQTENAGRAIAAAVGLALALDSPPEGISLRDANLALLGTALGAAAGLIALAFIAGCLTRHWQRIGARVLGSWIAASAVLVLALRLVR